MAEQFEIEVEEESFEDEVVEVFIDDEGVASFGDEFDEDYAISFGENIAEILDESTRGELASKITSYYHDDLDSRQDWYETFRDGLDLLGIKTNTRSEPFEGASGVYHPLLAEAVTHFQAQTYRELLPAGGPVDTQVMGVTSDPKLEQANRVKNFMNYQLTYKMEEYDPEMDQMLFYLPLAGSAFKKSYYDPSVGRAVSRFVKAEDLVVPYTTNDLVTASRITHVIRMTENDLKKLQLSGFYRDVSMGSPSYIKQNDLQDKIDELEGVDRTGGDDEYTLLEVHGEFDLDGFEDKDENGEPTGLALPYIITICLDTNEVLSIRQNYDPTDPMRRKVEYFTHYKFLPGLGFYGFGLIHMIGGVTKSAIAV